MAARVAINGFGRIGRLALRAAVESERKDLNFVAVNDFGNAELNAHLLKHDTVHGRMATEVRASGGRLKVNGFQMAALSEADAYRLPWKNLSIDIVLECTGRQTNRSDAHAHIDAGARRVLVSAPLRGADTTVVFGINDDDIEHDHTVISNSSSATNCLAPVAKVIDDLAGIERGFMTIIHAMTNDQPPLDAFHRDFLLARSAGGNVIATPSGSAKAVGLVLKGLLGRIEGAAIRVPTMNVSLIDLKVTTAQKTTAGDINRAFEEAAARGAFKGVLQVNALPLASSDFNHNPASAIVDLASTTAVDGRFVRVLAWYDNEWGYANRLLDTAAVIARHLN